MPVDFVRLMHHCAPMLNMFVAVLCFTVANFFVKSHPEIPFYQWAFFRAGFILVVAFFYLRIKKVNVLGQNRPLLFLRGLFGTVGIVLYFYTIQNTSLGTATTIQYMSPLFAVAIAYKVFNEPIGKIQIMAFAMALLGVILMKLGDIRLSDRVALLGIIAALASASAYNCIRQLRTTDHPMTVVFYFPLITFPATGFFVVRDWVQPSAEAWLHIFIFSLLNLIAQYLMTISYQQNLVKTVSIIKYIGVVLSFGIGWIYFSEEVTWLTSVGVAFVLFALYINRQRKPKALTQS